MKAGLRRHGETHDPFKGSDPIPNVGSGWQFNVDNEGGWGYVITQDSTDISFGTLGLVLGDESGEGTFLFAKDGEAGVLSSVTLTPDSLTVALGSNVSLILDRATGTITAYDSSSNPLFQMTDGSPDLHLPVGGNIVFDLS